MGADAEDFGAGWSRPLDLRDFYKAVVQANLLFDEELWVTHHWIGRTLGGFHHRVDRYLENMNSNRDLYAAGNCNEGSGSGVGGYVRPTPP